MGLSPIKRALFTKPTKQVVKAVTTDKQQAEAMPSNIYPLHPPLRVIRVEDSSPKMAGRMVISGRMADVCAELDRLAA